MAKLDFKKGDSILQTLASSDPKMALLFEKIGDYSLNLRTDYFPSIVRTIIGQQLGVGAARTIWERTKNLCGQVTPMIICDLLEEDLKNVGISGPKISYLKNLAKQINEGELDLMILETLPNSVVIEKLTKVKGIGVWTAEMFLIFSLGRLDVLSLNDLGLKRATQWLYGLKNIPAERAMKSYGKKWAPYQTVASLYLWEAINQGLLRGEVPTL